MISNEKGIKVMAEKKTHKIDVAGLSRELPIVRISDKVSIAVLIMFSDVELTVNCAAELLKKTPEFDVILTAEAKGIPLAYEMSRQSGKNYVVARKNSKLYMEDPIEVEAQSITTASKQRLFLDVKEAGRLKGRRVLVVDDVISTGGSLLAMQKLVEAAGGNIVCKAAALAEGEASCRNDLVFLGAIPLFIDE